MTTPWLLGALVLLIAGCGPHLEYYAPEPDPYYARVLAPGHVEPADADEQALLTALGELPAGEARDFGGWHVLAGDPYVAASGLVCRSVLQTSSTSGAGGLNRLACRDGQEWFFTPDVFAANPEPESSQ